MKKGFFYLLVMSLLAISFPSIVRANVQESGRTIVVTSAEDSGEGSFRSALQNAREGDYITFDSQTFPVDNPTRIFPESPLPTLDTGNITIDGTGAGVILDGSLLGAPTQLGFIDDVQLFTETGENLIVNGDFQSDLNHWMLWQRGEDEKYLGTARWTDTEGVESPGAVSLAPHSRGGAIILAYHDRDENLNLTGVGNEPSGMAIPLSVEGTRHLTLMFQYKRINIDMRLEVNNEDGSGSFDVYDQSFAFSDEWRLGLYELDVPAGATELFLAFDIAPTEYFSALVVESNGNLIQGLQIENFPGDAIFLANARQNRIGGARLDMNAACLSPCNLLSGNIGSGVFIEGGGENIIQGNFIGIDIGGKTAQANGLNGIRLSGTAHNLIGGEGGEGNIISTNSMNIEIINGASNNEIKGNFIGVDISGQEPLSTPHIGVSLAFGVHDNLIEDNVISANEVGIQLDQESHHNQIKNNIVGSDLSHTLILGNQTGIVISNDSFANQIGPGNYILFNRYAGVYLSGETTLGNRITQNTIEENRGGQIVVDTTGDWLSPAVITKATTREVSGLALPNSTVEIYTGDTQDGGEYVKTVETDQFGTFQTTFAQDKLRGKYITLLTFDADGTTSEFSTSLIAEQLILRTVPGLIRPDEVSTDIRVISINALLAIFILFYVGIGSTYFNEALENYPDDIDELFVAPLKKRLGRIFPSINKTREYNFKRILISWLLILVLISLIQSFLDIESIFTLTQLKVILTLFLGGFIVSSLQTLGEILMRKSFKRAATPTQAKVALPGVILAGISTFFSLLFNLVPGLVLGAVDTFFLLPELADESEDDDTLNAWRVLIVKSTVLVITFLGWWFSEKTGNLMPLMELSFAVGLQYAFFELIPLDVLDGSVLLKTKKWTWSVIWGILIGLTSFGLFHLVLNPNSSDVRDIMQGSVRSLALVFATLGILIVAMRWAIARHRKEKFEMTAPAWGTVVFIVVFLAISLLVQYGAVQKIGTFDVQEEFFAEPTPTPEPPTPYTTLPEANFDLVEGLGDFALFVEVEEPSQVSVESFLQEGTLRIGGGNLLREVTSLEPAYVGSFARAFLPSY